MYAVVHNIHVIYYQMDSNMFVSTIRTLSARLVNYTNRYSRNSNRAHINETYVEFTTTRTKLSKTKQ